MATYEKYCAQCGKRFSANRVDANWCSGACAAKYYRDNPNPEYIHAKKEHVHWYECDYCKQAYVVNDYAKRSGKRTPRFCSVKCKQASWRYTQKEQAARRQEQETRPGGDNRQRTEREKQDQQDARREYKQQNQGGNGGYKSTGYPKERDPYVILGIDQSATTAQITAAWKAMIKKYHPDVYKNDDATAKAQAVNWAYDWLMPKDRHTKKRSKRL